LRAGLGSHFVSGLAGAEGHVMSDKPAAGSTPATTRGALPPGIDAPSPPEERDRIAAGSAVADDVERDIRRLADRVGGMARLRDLAAELARSPGWRGGG
jgi:hypothetical protein